MYRNQGIRTNAIAPGGTAAKMIPVVDENAHGPKVLAPYRVNVGRVSQPEEQAPAIMFLASDAASNVNGVILPVDNGWAAV
jgi:NAD(P)-dependent dehydrogenase (short-subunit alcohol dehydrogenase family)